MDFPAAFDLHVDDVYGYLAFRTGSQREAEQLTQETFERASHNWGSFDAEASVRAWLVAIARHAYIGSRSRARALPEAGEAEAGGGADFAPEPKVASALRRLQRREREVIALRFGSDMRVPEIAAVLGVSASNARQTLARALRRLHAALA